MNENDLEQRARKLLALEYENEGSAVAAEAVRDKSLSELIPAFALPIRAIVAALRQQPAPVVDDAMVRDARYWRTLMANCKRDHIWHHVLPPDLTEHHNSIEAVLDALARAQGVQS